MAAEASTLASDPRGRSGSPGHRPQSGPLIHATTQAWKRPASPVAALDERTGILQFMVVLGQERVTAFISHATWRAMRGSEGRQQSLIDIYRDNKSAIDAAVVRRVVDGGRQPVVLRVSDL